MPRAHAAEGRQNSDAVIRPIISNMGFMSIPRLGVAGLCVYWSSNDRVYLQGQLQSVMFRKTEKPARSSATPLFGGYSGTSTSGSVLQRGHRYKYRASGTSA